MKKLHFLLFILVFTFLKTKAAPIISNFAYITNTCSSTSKAFTVNISDAAGIATGSLTPRVYFRKNMGPYTSATGTLTTGNLTNGVWTFNMTYTITGNDFIYFYTVAQNTTGNVSAFPTSGFSATNVNAIITDANDPLGFYFGILNGTYTVGNGGNFTRLTDAAVAFSSSCASMLGPVTFVLTDTAYKPSTGEAFPIVFGSRWESSNTNSLLIMPATGTNVNITSDTNSTSVIKFLNTRYFTFDGDNGTGNGITVRSAYSGTITNSSVFIAGAPATAQGCKNGTIKQIDIYGSFAFNDRSGIFIGLDGASQTGANNDSLDISYNRIYRSNQAIFALGTNTVTTINGLTINSNTVGPSTSTPTNNAITGVGINIVCAKGINITKNIVQNCKQDGLQISLSNTLTVADNTIRAINGQSFWYARGIWIGTNTGNGVIKNNLIHNINNIYPGYGAQGMYVCGFGLKIENNMIHDIQSFSSPNFTTWPVGIYLDGPSGITIDNNSVNLNGSYTGTTGTSGSSAFLVTGPGSMANYDIKVRNNVFCNTYNNSSSTTDTCYSIYSTATVSNFTVMNYNDYYVGGTGNNPVLGWYQTIKLPSLSNIQSSFGGNLNSHNVAPVFVSPSDLHLITSANPALDNNGTPISGLTTDFDNQSRSSSVPDIGADEFLNTSPCTTSLYGNIVTTSFTACSNSTIALNFIGGGSGTGFTYQWKYSSTSSGPYSNVIGGIGATTTNYTTAPLSAGTYYYVLEKTCTSASMTTISNEATVTINPTPTASASCSPTAVCSGTVVNFTGGTDIGTVFSWSSPMGPWATTQNFNLLNTTSNQSGIYTLTVTLGNCKSTATTALVVHPIIQPTISGAPSITICPGSNATLSAVGCTSYTWNSTITGSIAVVSPTFSGTSYLASGTDTYGCVGSSIIYIYLYPSPNVSATANAICDGQTSILSVNGASSYNWNTGPTTQTIAVTPSVTTTYTVTGLTPNGCSFVIAKTITVNPLPNINASSSTSVLCSGQSATLTATGGVAYFWNPVGIWGNPIIETPTITTTYTVTGYSAVCSQTAVITQSVSTCTNLNESSFTNTNVNISPNPSNGNFVLFIAKEIERGELRVFNNLGQEVYKTTISNGRNEIKLENIAKGLYNFHISSKSNPNYVGKFILD